MNYSVVAAVVWAEVGGPEGGDSTSCPSTAGPSVELEDHGDEVAVLVRNQVTVIDVADERRLLLRAGATQFKVEGRQVVCAPMPGKVVELF